MSDVAGPVTARFTMQRGIMDYVPEAELEAGVAEAIAAKGRTPFGQVVLDGAGQAPIGMYDELMPMAESLKAAADLVRRGEGANIGSFSQPDTLLFAPDGAAFTVTDQNGDTRRYDRDRLAAALAGCFGRLLALLGRLETADPDWKRQLAELA